ncbi:RICIN domain-containing protein [Faecalibaculum rodentium]|uniref:RICIN domain-containing protein n=1 Tax=Faecalibaculum rodentium TaxID=1702221 RepID=UPI001C3C7E6E|nr:RICIN domain-containing protein [Faecalibaculum rodentium]
MKRKDILMLTASMMGIASGWAVLNDQVYAMTDEEPLPRFEEAVSEDKNIADDSIVLPEAPAEPTAVTEQSADTELADPAAIDGKAANLTDKSSPEKPAVPTETEKTDEDAAASDNVDDTDGSVSSEDSDEISPEAKGDKNDSLTAEPGDQAALTEAKLNVAKAPLRAAAGPTNGWVNNKYYVNGVVSTGETTIGQDRYLFDNAGNALKGFMYYDGRLLYCASNGKIQTGSFTVDKQTFTADSTGAINSMNCQNIPYYNQLDPRWSGYVIGQGTMGSTACTMMSLTTVVNYFNNTNYSPVDIAIDCHNAGYYNGRVPGTIASVWKYASNKYGLTYKEGLTLNSIAQSLLEGNIVVGGVGYSRWCPWYGSTHQIYLTGYRNGQVQVYDPYQTSQCGWFSLNDIWNVKSTDPDDNLNNGPFFALGKRNIATIHSSLAAYGTVVIGDQAYTGAAVRGNPIVGFYQNGSYVQLQEGRDYTVSYANNTNAGEARITVTGKGFYKGTISRTFYIVNNVIRDSTYTLQSSGNTNYVLDVPGASKSSGTQLQLYSGNHSAAQQYIIKRQANGYYTIQNKNSGLYLTSDSDWRNVHNGLRLTQKGFKSDSSCLWMIRATSNGYVISSSIDSQYVLDVPAAIFADYSKIQLYARNGSKAQAWRLVDLEQAVRELEQLAAANKNTVSDGFYIIQSAIDRNQVVDAAGAGTGNGTNIQIYASNGTKAQLFQISHSGNYLKITNANSGKVLDVAGGIRQDGTNIQLYDWNGSKAQLWIAVNANDGIKLVSALDKNLVMDLYGAVTANGNNISVYASNNTKAQRWIFKKEEDPRAAMDRLALAGKNLVSEGIYEIHSAINSRFNLDVTAGSTNNRANVQLYTDNDSGAQRWIISFDNKGYATIKNQNSGHCLSLASNVVQSGTNILQSSGSTYSQKWIFKKNGNFIQIASAWNDKYVIDLSGAHAVDGRNIQLYANNGSNAQNWQFIKIAINNGAAGGSDTDNNTATTKPIIPIKAEYWNGQELTPKLGTVNGPSGKETYYNLNMTGVIKIMRSIGNTDEYWLREDGVKMLGKYVMVAANLEIRPRGSLIKTTLGMGIVCDTGDFVKDNPTQLDIAVGWRKDVDKGIYYIDAL